MKREKSVIVLAAFFTIIFYKISSATELAVLEPITPEDKILILAPHPDDEALACAGIIQEALKKKAQVKIAYLTNGDHNQIAFIVYEKRLVFRKNEFIHMGEVRRQEAVKALACAGLTADNLIFLGYPDFGTFAMFYRYWKSVRPFKSMLTRINKVPYPENFSYGKKYSPENILSDIENIIEAYKPTKIFVSHPADTNGDHRAFGLFLSVALWDLEEKIPPPKIYNYLIHHINWPLPHKYHPQLSLNPPQDLENAGIWASFRLSQDMVTKKYSIIGNYKSQTESSAFYLFSFARENELFVRLPAVNLNSQKSAAVDSFTEYAVKDDQLIITLRHPSENHDIARITFYLFGYRKDAAFADMPKIFLILHNGNLSIFNGKNSLQTDSVTYETNKENIVLKIPLQLLGNPEKALVSAHIFSKAVPYVQSVWRQFEFK